MKNCDYQHNYVPKTTTSDDNGGTNIAEIYCVQCGDLLKLEFETGDCEDGYAGVVVSRAMPILKNRFSGYADVAKEFGTVVEGSTRDFQESPYTFRVFRKCGSGCGAQLVKPSEIYMCDNFIEAIDFMSKRKEDNDNHSYYMEVN